MTREIIGKTIKNHEILPNPLDLFLGPPISPIDERTDKPLYRNLKRELSLWCFLLKVLPGLRQKCELASDCNGHLHKLYNLNIKYECMLTELCTRRCMLTTYSKTMWLSRAAH